MNTPKIRFKGFTDDWEQRKLGEMVIDHNAGIYISKEDYGEGTNVIGVGNIYDRDIFDGEIYRLGPVNDDKFILEENDIIYGESSLVPEGIARTVCVGKNCAGSAFAWHTRRVKLDKNIVNSHVATLELNYLHEIRKYLVSVSTQTALTGMTTEGYFGATLTLPSVEEQQVISDYFKNIDYLITLHQRKCDETKQLKKFMLQKMFPKNGEKNPEIRFKGFTDDWEQRKVGEVTKELLDYDNFSSGLPLLTSSRSGLMYQSEYRGNATTENENTLFSVVPLNACTYRHMSDDSTFHLNINTLEKGLVSKEYPVFQENESNLKFIVQYINSSNSFTKFCTEQKKGGTRTRLYYKTLCEYKLMMPSIKEQNKTANFFDTLDHLITLHQRKCEKLKELKKFMLQNMFV